MAGGDANESSSDPSIDDRGDHIAFTSAANNLAPGDTNGEDDVFLADLPSGSVLRASLDSRGRQADGASDQPSITGDGGAVAFATDATNLTPGDGNEATDVLLRDLRSSTTTLVSIAAAGTPGDGASGQPAASADGSTVAFVSSASDLVAGKASRGRQVYVRDFASSSTTFATGEAVGGQPLGYSRAPSLSADGSRVALLAWTLDAKGAVNPRYDVFVSDLVTGGTERISLAEHLPRSFANRGTLTSQAPFPRSPSPH